MTLPSKRSLAPGDPRPTIRLDIDDSLVERAVRAVLDDVAWPRSDTRHSIIVTDQRIDATVPIVEVIRVTPAACATTLRRFTDRRIAGAVCAHDTERLPDILVAIAVDLRVLPKEIVERAAAVPALSERQASLLSSLMAGLSNRQISRTVHASEATVKRDIAVISRAFGATSRVAIVKAAFALGFEATDDQ